MIINKLTKSFWLMGSMILGVHAAENPYIEQYGRATLVSAREAYPDFSRSLRTATILPRVLGEIAVVIASEKQVKTDAVKRLFAENRRFEPVTITFLSINVNSDIANQPVGRANGRLGALNRINNIIKSKGFPKEHSKIFICAIENYFEESETAPRDHAYVMIQSPDGQLFEAVSVGVAIDPAVYGAAISEAERVVNDEGFFTGYSKTIGSYLQERYEFKGSDWFREAGAKINRLDQILTTLDDGPWF